MKLNERNVCSFENWYPLFKKYSFKSECLPVPEDVLEYLKKDVVTIPVEAALKKVKSESVDDISYSSWDSEGEDEDEIIPPSFPEFSAKLKNVIDRLGGSAFIKMNWSAPNDAAWVATNNSLQCCNLQDVYLLLKCSDKITRDLAKTSECYIVLKKWEDIHPGSEFRCFVMDNEIVAITQRSKSEFHRYILVNKFNIIGDLKEFFKENVKGKFLLNNFVFDVVWNSGSRIKIVDFGVLNIEETDGYLFTLTEIFNLKYDEELSPEFRFIGEDIGIQPGNLSRHFGMPIELSGESRSLVELLQSQINIQAQEEE